MTNPITASTKTYEQESQRTHKIREIKVKVVIVVQSPNHVQSFPHSHTMATKIYAARRGDESRTQSAILNNSVICVPTVCASLYIIRSVSKSIIVKVKSKSKCRNPNQDMTCIQIQVQYEYESNQRSKYAHIRNTAIQRTCVRKIRWTQTKERIYFGNNN